MGRSRVTAVWCPEKRHVGLSACVSLSEADTSVGWRFREETVWGVGPRSAERGRLILLVISCGIGCSISK